jgi:hypothetical protein
MGDPWDKVLEYAAKLREAQEAAGKAMTSEELAIASAGQENPPIFGAEPNELSPPLWKRYFETNGFPLTIIPNMDTVGNFMTFGPLGKYSKYGTLLVSMVAARYTNTPKGQQLLAQMVIEYLRSMAKVISSMQTASSANWLNALMNQRTTINMLARVGLVSPYDQFSESVWLDHVFAEMLKLSYTQETIGSLTTLVTGSNYEIHGAAEKGATGAFESAEGVAAFAKILAGK